MPEPLFVRRPDVLATPLPGDELALLHPETQRYYTLNETGRFLWGEMERPVPLSALTKKLTDVYDATPDEARQSVHAVVDLLCRENLALMQTASADSAAG